MSKNLIVLIVASFLTLNACNTRPSEKTKDDKFKLNIESVTTVIPQLHSISEIKAIFNAASVEFYPEIISNTSNAELFIGEQKIAANLGVYLADLIYVFSTSEEDNNEDKYKAIFELSEKYDFANDLLGFAYQRYENDNATLDDFFEILENGLEMSSKKMNESEVSEFSSYLIFGNYIEKMYIISSLAQRKNDKLSEEEDIHVRRGLLSLLANQSGRIDELIYIMSKYPDQWTNVLILEDLNLLLSYYVDVEGNRDELLKLTPAEILRATEVTSILKQIEKIRNRIVLP